LRVSYDRAPHRDSLALTSGEVPRLPVEVRLEIEELRSLENARLAFFLRHALLLQRKAHVRGDVELRVQRVALEHHCDVAVSGAHRRDVLAADQDLALVERLEPR